MSAVEIPEVCYAGDFGFELTLPTKVDLTGSTDVTLTIRREDGTFVTRTIADVDVLDRELGTVRYLTQDGDFPEGRLYHARVRGSAAGVIRVTSRWAPFYVLPEPFA
jgi:hypothetical protein